MQNTAHTLFHIAARTEIKFEVRSEDTVRVSIDGSGIDYPTETARNLYRAFVAEGYVTHEELSRIEAKLEGELPASEWDMCIDEADAYAI
jgi:hypothetical protein